MTTPAFSAPDAPTRLTYARARLLIGISGVGTCVLVAAALIGFGIPAEVLSRSNEQPLLHAVTSLLLAMLIGVAMLFPFDLLGGFVVVRQRPRITGFLRRWTRGVAVHLSIGLVCITVLMSAARVGGTAAVVASFVVLQGLLAALRGPLVRMIAAFSTDAVPKRARDAAQRAGIAPKQLVLLSTSDEGFVGGWTGIAPRQLLVPARWLALPDQALVAALQRRRIIAQSGAHRRGVLSAIGWNTIGFALVLTVTSADVATAAGVLTMAAGMTLWAFVGVLVLPTPSRAAVFAIDQAAARNVGTKAVQDAIERLDCWQDDEERRSAGVETIFHPVPSRSARVARLRHTEDQASSLSHLHAHHLARHALWLGWGTLSPISRAVHCNVGRPALWAMLPGD